MYQKLVWWWLKVNSVSNNRRLLSRRWLSITLYHSESRTMGISKIFVIRRSKGSERRFIVSRFNAHLRIDRKPIICQRDDFRWLRKVISRRWFTIVFLLFVHEIIFRKANNHRRLLFAFLSSLCRWNARGRLMLLAKLIKKKKLGDSQGDGCSRHWK